MWYVVMRGQNDWVFSFEVFTKEYIRSKVSVQFAENITYFSIATLICKVHILYGNVTIS